MTHRGTHQLWLCLVAVALAAPLAAQQPPLSPEVNQAIDRGVAYLKKTQQADGSWQHDRKGATTLAAWTLLECDVSPNDANLRKAVDFTRDYILTSDRTYEIALAILLLDRLGDPDDVALIEVLTLQLLGGQNAFHGWSYTCPPLSDKELNRLQQHLARQKENGPRKLPEKPPANKAPREPKEVHADVMALAAALNNAPVPMPLPGFVDDADNSNTQFAILALWVARRYGLPVDKALQRAETRFRATQHKSGGWPYDNRPADAGQKPGRPTAAMTACGLLALAIGSGTAPAKGPAVDFNKDPVVKNGLFALSASVGEPGQPRDKLLLSSAGRSYYFLWTLERMAVIYNLKTIGGKDWYEWGKELLLANQQGDGSWQGEFAQGGCDTCFALLFLRRVNVANDLTARIGTMVKDPGKAPKDLLDLIGQEVQPGIDKKPPPKMDTPEPEEAVEQLVSAATVHAPRFTRHAARPRAQD